MTQPGPSDYRSSAKQGVHHNTEGIMDQVSDLGARAETMGEEVPTTAIDDPKYSPQCPRRSQLAKYFFLWGTWVRN
jgi:hypothetical protein